MLICARNVGLVSRNYSVIRTGQGDHNVSRSAHYRTDRNVIIISFVCLSIIIHCSSGIYQDSFSQFCNAEGSCSSAQVGPILRTFGQNPSEAEIQVGGWSFLLRKATQALTNLAHFSRRQIQFHNKQNRQTSNVVVS